MDEKPEIGYFVQYELNPKHDSYDLFVDGKWVTEVGCITMMHMEPILRALRIVLWPLEKEIG